MSTTPTQQPLPVTGPTAWRASDTRDPSAWTLSLSGSDIEQLREGFAGRSQDARRAEPTDFPPRIDVDPPRPLAADFTPPILDDISSALRDGRGFVLVKGFPVASGDDDAFHFFLEFGRLLGRPEPQNRAGDLLSRVQSEDSGPVRGARTNRALLYHTDFAASIPSTLGLLAVREARTGGESMVLSGHSLHNALLERQPNVLAHLYESFYFDRTGYVTSAEESVFRAPIFARDGDRLDLLYNRARLHRGHRMSDSPLRSEDLKALDAFDDLLADPEEQFTLRFTLAAGSALFASNRVILHNRTAFADHPEPHRKRLLLRMWLDA